MSDELCLTQPHLDKYKFFKFFFFRDDNQLFSGFLFLSIGSLLNMKIKKEFIKHYRLGDLCQLQQSEDRLQSEDKL